MVMGTGMLGSAGIERTVEYALLIKRLRSAPGPISFEGRYCQVRNLRMGPPLPTGLFPGILISGSSPAGLAAAKATGATWTVARQRFPLDLHAGNLPAIRLYRAAGFRVRSTTAGAGGDLTYLRMSLGWTMPER
jgi:alkanesulfonate monooxygenase SsuD/methylene tetrahydromethanopterin reductase-like flavin-dependent oxidoreductase (luciferase family)